MTIAEIPSTILGRGLGTTVRPSPAATVDGSARIALLGAAAAVPPITLLHLSAHGPVEPAGWTISDYVVSLPNGSLLFALTTGALALGAAALVRGLAPAAGSGWIRGLLAVWAAGLLIAAAFPTNERGTPEDLSSQIHLYAGAVAFAALPIAGFLLARRLARPGPKDRWTSALLGTSVISGVLSAALILNRFPGVIGMPELMLPPGILQRAAGAVEIALLAVAALAVLRSRSDARR